MGCWGCSQRLHLAGCLRRDLRGGRRENGQSDIKRLVPDGKHKDRKTAHLRGVNGLHKYGLVGNEGGLKDGFQIL